MRRSDPLLLTLCFAILLAVVALVFAVRVAATAKLVDTLAAAVYVSASTPPTPEFEASRKADPTLAHADAAAREAYLATSEGIVARSAERLNLDANLLMLTLFVLLFDLVGAIVIHRHQIARRRQALAAA